MTILAWTIRAAAVVLLPLTIRSCNESAAASTATLAAQTAAALRGVFAGRVNISSSGIVEAPYSKRLGLPGYSSHQFSVSVETELVQVDDVAGESQRLYQLLQANVDEQIRTTGFVPAGDYGMNGGPNGAPRAAGASAIRGDHGAAFPGRGQWKCSDKQRELINR